MAADLTEIRPERVNRTWMIYVCAEPDGENCASGTHPHILRHECAALRRWHEAMAARRAPGDDVEEPGPHVVMVEVAPVHAELSFAFCELYDSAIRVVDRSNPQRERERRRMSLMLDRLAAVRFRVEAPDSPDRRVDR